MKTIQFTGYGAAPVLNGVAEPTVGEDDVLVWVAGVALNPVDVKPEFHSPPCGRRHGRRQPPGGHRRAAVTTGGTTGVSVFAPTRARQRLRTPAR
jgi:hypothetical protein